MVSAKKMKGKHGKGRGSFKKKGPKISQSKLANKRNAKLAKQGKLKREKKKPSYMARSGPSIAEDIEENSISGEGDQNGLCEEDMEFYSTPDHNSIFIKHARSSILLTESKKGKKRKSDSDDEVEDFEKVPRKLFASDNNIKPLLPIKTKHGIVAQQMYLQPEEKERENGAEEKPAIYDKTEKEQEILPPVSHIKLYADRQEKLMDRKRRIAMLASAIIENPQENMRKLKELRLMLDESDPDVYLTVRKLVLVSLLEVFKDIVPGYRLRLPTDAEKQVKLKKETKTLRDFEASFLMNYKSYLEFLEKTCKGTNRKKWELGAAMAVPQQAKKTFTLLSLKCLSELLITHLHFNYRNNIIMVLVPFMNNQDSQMSKLVCDVVRRVFREDKLGEASLELVKNISKMVKVRESRVQRQVLDSFLSLKIKQVDFDKEAEQQSKKEKKDMRSKMSRREKKRKKKMQYLEKELLETKATEDKNKRLRLHTEIIECVFYTYFRILKGSRKSVLLAPVLEGLAKFAHLINVDFFDDLFKVFNELIDSGDLTYRESLHCVKTAFTILSGQGSVLNIDPMRFYSHLYNAIFKVHAGISSGDISIVLDCVDCMLGRRKRQVSQQRVLAFLKRLSTSCLQQSGPSTLALLSSLRNFFVTYKSCELLFDNETQGSGTFLPELSDPEHCNAHNTMLWELGYLHHHYHPVVRKYASHISKLAPTTGEGQLTSDLARRSPLELLQQYQCISEESLFIPSPPDKSSVKKKMYKPPGSFIQSAFSDLVTRTFSSVDDNVELISYPMDPT